MDENQKLLENPQQSHHKFLYIFDFGDSWKFVCKLKKIETNEEPLQKHQIVEAVGKSPKQ